MDENIKSSSDLRSDFLFKMYDQMFNDINTHILVVWQSIGVLVSTFAVYALVEKSIININLANSIILLVCGWQIAHIIDSGYWYNRNLVIIANIERQFLTKDDLHNIHYYFGKHRTNNKMILHLRIQVAFSIGLAFIILFSQTISSLCPGISQKPIDVFIFLPYFVLIIVVIYLLKELTVTKKKYNEFIKNSPGMDIDTTGIDFGVGHGFKK